MYMLYIANFDFDDLTVAALAPPIKAFILKTLQQCLVSQLTPLADIALFIFLPSPDIWLKHSTYRSL